MRKYLRKLKGIVIYVSSLLITKISFLFYQDYRKLKTDKQPKIIMLDLPTHENLGDHAIAVVEYDFIKNKYPQSYIYRFSYNQCKFCLYQIKKYIKEDDKIFLPGGGFLGTLWKRENDIILKILTLFSHNRVVIFPQTVYFNEKCIDEVNRFKHVVNEHTDLTICVREKKSYSILRKLVKCNIVLVPDIVLAYQGFNGNQRKNGKILLCFRNDKERMFNPDRLINYLDSHCMKYDYSSTIADSGININEAAEVVSKKIELFSQYSLVICDRLHAMIFSYLGETPCMAFDNISQKVSGVYEWIKEVEGCECINDESGLDYIQINNLMSTKVEKVDLTNTFSLLYEII